MKGLLILGEGHLKLDTIRVSEEDAKNGKVERNQRASLFHKNNRKLRKKTYA